MTTSDSRGGLGTKLVPLETALAEIESGHTVAAAPYSCTPYTLCKGLRR